MSGPMRNCLVSREPPRAAEFPQAFEQEVEKYPEPQRVQTHPGVGALTTVALVLIIDRADRFQCGKQIASYLGRIRCATLNSFPGVRTTYLFGGSFPPHSRKSAICRLSVRCPTDSRRFRKRYN